MTLLTVGHGADDRDRLGSRLAAAQVQQLVDVRRYPASRRNPDVGTNALADWLPAAGIAYRWEEALGGRRRLPAGEPVADGWWSVEQFAAYAAHTRTLEFLEAFDRVLASARDAVVAVMCSESVWWRCHRRLIADVAVVGRGLPVTHVLPGGRPAPHRPSEAAIRDDAGLVHWPASPR